MGCRGQRLDDRVVVKLRDGLQVPGVVSGTELMWCQRLLSAVVAAGSAQQAWTAGCAAPDNAFGFS
jgi:hypothetical protein